MTTSPRTSTILPLDIEKQSDLDDRAEPRKQAINRPYFGPCLYKKLYKAISRQTTTLTSESPQVIVKYSFREVEDSACHERGLGEGVAESSGAPRLVLACCLTIGRRASLGAPFDSHAGVACHERASWECVASESNGAEAGI